MALRRAALLALLALAEQGLPGQEAGTWYGVYTRASVPQPASERLAQEVRRAVEDPKSREAIAAQGVEARASTPAEFRALFRDTPIEADERHMSQRIFIPATTLSLGTEKSRAS